MADNILLTTQTKKTSSLSSGCHVSNNNDDGREEKKIDPPPITPLMKKNPSRNHEQLQHVHFSSPPRRMPSYEPKSWTASSDQQQASTSSSSSSQPRTSTAFQRSQSLGTKSWTPANLPNSSSHKPMPLVKKYGYSNLLQRSSSTGISSSSGGGKSWTDQRAPEPFSSPAPKNSRASFAAGSSNNRSSISSISQKKKYGYGNLFRSASAGVGGAAGGTTGGGAGGSRPGLIMNDGATTERSRAFFHSNISGCRAAMMQKRPSFTKRDFPVLSPVKPKQQRPAVLKREASWSAVVGASSERDLASSIISVDADGADADATNTTAGDDFADEYLDDVAGIPPPPFCTDMVMMSPPQEEEVEEEEEEEVNTTTCDAIEVDKEVSSEEEEEDVAIIADGIDNGDELSSSPIQSSRTYWHQRRQRAHSFHHYPPNHKSSSPSPTTYQDPLFSTFTTRSRSALQNDIGTLLARSNRVSEAIERYKLSIELAQSNLEGLQSNNDEDENKNNENSDEDDTDQVVFGNNHNSGYRPKKCPKVTEAEGLAWFRQKLLRGDIAVPPPGPVVPSVDDEFAVGRSTIDGSSCLSSQHDDTTNTSHHDDMSPAICQRQQQPFQPAGFGGYALQSPRGRLRSASFSVVDLCVVPTHPSSKKLLMPSVGQVHSLEAEEHPKLATPLRPIIKSFARTSSTPGQSSNSMVQQQQSRTTVPQQHQFSRGVAVAATGTIPTSSVLNHHASPPLDDIVHDIHQHTKLDCPDHEVYSCNGLTPLGLEYVCDPLPILGSSLRTLITASSSGGGGSKDTRNKKMDNVAIMMESAALIAARLNLASLDYRLAGGGVSDKLQEALDILELALEDCHNAFKLVENIARSKPRQQFIALFSMLKAVVYSNIGAVKYRLKKVRDAMASFEMARSALIEKQCSDDNGSFDDFDLHNNTDEDIAHTCSNRSTIAEEPHDDNRFPPRNYLLLVVRLNLSRVSLILNKQEDAAEYCNSIAKDSRPHVRRSSSRHSFMQPHGSLFRRSNSFSAASTALHTAIAAYEHDIDRRSKWLASVSEHYITGLIHESKDTPSDYKEAWHHYNRLLSTARVKLDHRHPYICALLERRGAVLFEQRRLQCSMLSYLACLKILEHQQCSSSTFSNVFNKADLSRVLYAVARVLHDKEEFHDALHMYQRALACQRSLAAEAGRPASLDVITTLCNISRVHHLAGEIDESLATNKEVLELATILVGGKMEHPFLIHRLKVEGNILVEARRLEDAMRTFVEAARRCSEDGRDEMITAMMGGGGGNSHSSSQEDADAGDSSVLSIRSAAALAHINFFDPAAASA
ncbi:hypothetical protein ACHAXR_013503 [Thalassiosira sp. AJA248-18]